VGISDTATGGEAQRVWTVSEVNRVVKDLIEQTLQPFWIRGEVSNLTLHSSGHVYFSLKDSRSQIAAVFFRGAETARQLQLKNGGEIDVWGRLTVYEPRGNYQVIVTRIRPQGVGALQKKFEELKKKLRDEGLFDPERKRPIPVLPRCVGVVTSPEGAAIRDFLQIVTRRFADVHIRICPAAVQGDRAAGEIAAALRYLNSTRACDVIVLTRGGGSIEDLWPFNEEIVARAVTGSKIPVISAVGHERDFTICDFCADLRAPTPSAAAELVVAKKTEFLDRLGHCRQRLVARLQLHLAEVKRRVERAAGHRVFQEPANLVRMYQQRLDELLLRLPRALEQRLERARAGLGLLAGKLETLNPHQVLGRGYAILLDPTNGRAVRATADTAPGHELRGILAQGQLRLTVTSVEDGGTGDRCEAPGVKPATPP